MIVNKVVCKIVCSILITCIRYSSQLGLFGFKVLEAIVGGLITNKVWLLLTKYDKSTIVLNCVIG